jgi:PAS domain S-box-containing protein
MHRHNVVRHYLSTMLKGADGALAHTDINKVCELLFMTAAEGLLVVDREGRIVMQNPGLGRMFGYGDDELIGQSMECLLPKAIRSRHEAHRAAYDRQPVQRSMGMGLDLMGQRKDGSVFPVEVSLNHFEVNGQRYVMALITDITLRHKAEEALRRSNEELEDRVEQRTAELRAAENNVRESLEKEKELHALKSRFVAMASHEFRTPLSTIMSSVDLIGRYTGNDEKVEKHVARIRTKVRELTSMLNEFLSLERIEHGEVQMNPAEFDIIHHCIEQLEELRGLAKAGQSIDYDHEGEERTVTTDRGMLGHVITNLVTNAVKYSPENAPIRMRTRLARGRLTVEVTDQGIGIPAEDQQHMFERFFRGGNVMTIQGTGLGLNIVKRYLDLMGGTISFRSRPGETVFTVELPSHPNSTPNTPEP